MSNITVLNVLLHGNLIGTITQIGNDRNLFAFTQNYIANESRDTLGLSFKDSTGELITDFRPYQTKVMPFFSNLLPEGKMREYLAVLAKVNHERDFYLLWALGGDLPGGLQILPADGEPPPGTTSSTAAEASNADMQADTVLKFSLAGVQIKFSALAQARSGLSIPAKGQGGNWIVKLPSREFDGVPENEFSMMQLAKMLGVDVPEHKLVNVEEVQNLPEDVKQSGSKAFAIKRFDRAADGSLIHIEDFAQIFDVYPTDKYKKASYTTIAQVLAIETNSKSTAEFIRRLTFNTLIGNGDMHIKNWSVIYKDKVNAELSPAYDFVSTIPYINNEKAALKFSRTNKFDEFNREELIHLAARARLPETMVVDTAKATIEQFHSIWAKEKTHLPLHGNVVKAIDKHLKTLPVI